MLLSINRGDECKHSKVLILRAMKLVVMKVYREKTVRNQQVLTSGATKFAV